MYLPKSYMQEIVTVFKPAIGEDSFVIFSVTASQSSFETDHFYDITLKKNLTMNNSEYPEIDIRNVIYSLSYGTGKTLQVEEALSTLKEKAEVYVKKKFGKSRIPHCEKVVQAAKEKNTTTLDECRTYIIYNSKYNTRFNSANFVSFDGEKLRVTYHQNQQFDTMDEQQWVIIKKACIKKDRTGLVINEDTSFKHDESDKMEIVDMKNKLYDLKHRETKSDCCIGRLIDYEFEHFNDSGKRFENGNYVVYRISERVPEGQAGTVLRFRVWSENVRCESKAAKGKYVCAPTSYRLAKNSKDVYNGTTIFVLKKFVYKRKSDAAMSPESVKVSKV